MSLACTNGHSDNHSDLIDKANAFKILANDSFKNNHYDEAIKNYTSAIDIYEDAVYYANRSLCHLKTESYGYALQDANKAIEINPKYIKAFYRRASANMALGKLKAALKDFEYVARVCPNDKDSKDKFKECSRLVTMANFDRAISVADKPSPLETLNPSQTHVEESYEGPRLDNDTIVTLDFIKALLIHFKEQKLIHRRYALQIIKSTSDYFKTQQSLVDIEIPDGSKFTICGDVHGQFYDLLNIFEVNGLPSEDNPYLFNGDFVDRGSFSTECIFTLLSFKLLYPNHFFMARGNHESENMNQLYGFDNEVKSKYSSDMVELFADLFNLLPLCHLINNRIFCMHGGLFSENGVTLDDLRKIDRVRQPPNEGLMCELLWSDPKLLPGRAPSKRGVGIMFGPDVTSEFCQTNNLDFIVRSHEVKNDGYEVEHDGKCITVFSAPNYCDSMGNMGAFINLVGSHKPNSMKPEFVSFKEVAHPNVKPMAYANSLLSLLS